MSSARVESRTLIQNSRSISELAVGARPRRDRRATRRPARRVEREVALERRRVPRRLLLLRLALDAFAHALEHDLDGKVGNLDVLEDVLGVDAVAAEAVRGHRARRGRVGDERPRGRAHLREARARHLEARGEGIVAAGVEDEEVEARLRAVHAVEDLADLDREERHVFLAAHGGVDRDEVVAILELHRVAGVEEERRVRAFERGAELADGIDHVLARGVLAHDDLEAELLQRLGEVARVVHGVAQRRRRVVVVADEQRHAVGGRTQASDTTGGAGERQQGDVRKRRSSSEKLSLMAAFHGKGLPGEDRELGQVGSLAGELAPRPRAHPASAPRSCRTKAWSTRSGKERAAARDFSARPMASAGRVSNAASPSGESRGVDTVHA